MPFLYKLEKKFGKYAIPGLTKYLIICYAIGLVLQLARPELLMYLTLDPYAILHGQIWRIFTWLLNFPGSIGFFTLITLYFYYSIGNTLERTWGTFRYNLFMLSGFLMMVIGAFLLYAIVALTGINSQFDMYMPLYADYGITDSLQFSSMMIGNLFTTYYISMSVFLAFAITFPDMQILFMLFIPIKVKVLGIIYVIIMAYQILTAFMSGFLYGMIMFIVIGFSLINVFVFFVVTRKSFRTPTQIKRQREYKKKMAPKGVTRHKCAVCGRTEESDPDEEFRFCSKCEGNYEYCSRHIYTHVHVKKDQ